MLPTVRESYEEMDVYHLGTIYGLPKIDVVGHVQSTVTVWLKLTKQILPQSVVLDLSAVRTPTTG